MEKSIDLLVYLWPQKWQKTAGLSIEYCGGGDMWFLNFTKPKIAHNSLNNGVRPVLTPFLDFQFFLTFCLENQFFGEKSKIDPKKPSV